VFRISKKKKKLANRSQHR